MKLQLLKYLVKNVFISQLGRVAAYLSSLQLEKFF